MAIPLITLKQCLYLFLLFNGVIEIKSASVVGDGPIVQTPKGPVQGVVVTTEQGREYNAFLGIPFGKPPVDELRYKVSKNSICSYS